MNRVLLIDSGIFCLDDLGMETLRIILPVYFFTYLFVCVFWRKAVFFKKTGKNPFIPGEPSTPHGFVAKCFEAVTVFFAVEVVAYGISPNLFTYSVLEAWGLPVGLKYLGLIFLLFSILITTVAQIQMGDSWRIGIGTEEKTDLVGSGLYAYSRNPIFLGMMSSVLGLFLVLPNTLSLLGCVLGCVLLEIMVRLEEVHLSSLHGQPYLDYLKRVRRWV